MNCPKCGANSGDDWSQCGKSCPMPGSPHYNDTAGSMKVRTAWPDISTCQIQQEISCINGLSAWFTIAVVYEPDYDELMMTDGAIGSAQETADKIVKALSA